jgi:mevalonate kinase
MPHFSASVPGKIILFGEHAVVYGYPAIAVPVNKVQAKVVITPEINAVEPTITIIAPDVGIQDDLDKLPPRNPISDVIQRVKTELKINSIPSCTIKISSTIPITAGLGSGASVSVAIIRSLSGFLGRPLTDKITSMIAFEVEKIHHGTPSGIDNTVVVYNKPVYFIKNHPLEQLVPGHPFTIVIGDTGIKVPTKDTVREVRQKWEKNHRKLEILFSGIGSITRTARKSIKKGDWEHLGPLLNENHELLQELGVSSQELDHLVNAAKEAGAEGAKLSGGGKGGNIVALTSQKKAKEIADAIEEAGAVRTIITRVK